jgi:hypothetical protein
MQALAAILDSQQDGFHDTADDQPEPMGHLANTLDPAENHIHRIRLARQSRQRGCRGKR